MDKPDVELHKRRSLTLKEKLDVMTRHPYCQKCGYKLGLLKEVEFDHVIALALGGTNDLTNFRGLHANCHKIKTADDKAAIAKAKRLEARRKGTRRPRKAIPSRAFPKRKMNERKARSSDTPPDETDTD